MLCIAGKNQIAVELLEYACRHYKNIKIVGSVNQSDYGEDTWQPSFYKACKKYKIPIVSLTDVFEEKNLCFLSLEYDKIIVPSNFVSKNLLNIHFSKLPQYRGMYTSVWPILNGEKTSGVTLHKIDFGIDTGDIIDQLSFEIGQEDTARDIYFKYLKYGTALVKANFNEILSGNYRTYPQSIVNASYYSKKSIDYKNIQINFNKTAYEVKNQLRAFYFPEYQVPICFGEKIRYCEISDQKSEVKPGKVLFAERERIMVSTIDYNVILYNL